MFGLHPRSPRAEEKLLQARPEGSGDSADPRPEPAWQGDERDVGPWCGGTRGLGISVGGEHASILATSHSTARENITCRLLAFPACNFGSIQQEKTQQERASELKPDPLKGRTRCLAFLTGSADLYVPAREGVMVPPTELH